MSVPQVNPLRPPTGVISKPIVPVLNVELRDVDRYDSMWSVDPKLSAWKRSSKKK